MINVLLGRETGFVGVQEELRRGDVTLLMQRGGVGPEFSPPGVWPGGSCDADACLPLISNMMNTSIIDCRATVDACSSGTTSQAVHNLVTKACGPAAGGDQS